MAEEEFEFVFICEDATADAIVAEFEALPQAVRYRRTAGSPLELERYALDFNGVACIATFIGTAIAMGQVAAALIGAAKRAKEPHVELRTPRGYVRLDLKGMTEKDVARALRRIAPMFDK